MKPTLREKASLFGSTVCAMIFGEVENFELLFLLTAVFSFFSVIGPHCSIFLDHIDVIETKDLLTFD